MNDLIQYAETEFGIPILDAEFDHMFHMMEHDRLLDRNKCYMGA